MGKFSHNGFMKKRVSNACDFCRKRKSKCDEQKPCRLCRRRNLQCIYRRPVLKPMDEALGCSQAGAGQSRTRALEHSINSYRCNSETYVYIKTFQEHILSLHPIIQPLLLHHWVKEFLNHPSTLYTSLLACPVEQSMPTSEEAANKKTRGSELFTTELPQTDRPDQSIHSALVLIIIALGKICLQRDNDPSAAHSAQSPPYNGLTSHNGDVSLSTSQGYPPNYLSYLWSEGWPLPNEQNEKIRQSSARSFCCGLDFEENTKETLGSGYFAYATSILRHHSGTSDIKYVYANIFAALYCGQLGRPKDSSAFLLKASGILQIIIQPVLEKMRKLKQNGELIQEVEHNQVALVFWTCLMLESDFKTEPPSSKLLLYEDSIPHPNMRLLDGFNKRVCDGYVAQIHLRKQLNHIYQRICTPELSADARHTKLGELSGMPNVISELHWVLPRFACEDGNTRNDVPAARLRAKYWGAQVVTYRPFIQQIISSSDSMRNQAGAITNISPQIIQLAKNGIDALRESLQAFDGLEDRKLIIPNILCLAHAHWGNLLVLSTAFRNPILHTYVDKEVLRILFHKTIRFLEQSNTLLQTKIEFLKGLQRYLFP